MDEIPNWAKPYLEMEREMADAMDSLGYRETRIIEDQKARKARRAPLFEVLAVPEDERSDEEKEWVKRHHEFMRRERW